MKTYAKRNKLAHTDEMIDGGFLILFSFVFFFQAFANCVVCIPPFKCWMNERERAKKKLIRTEI